MSQVGVALVVLLLGGCKAPPSNESTAAPTLRQRIEARIATHPGPIAVGLWLGEGTDAVRFERHPDAPRAVASAIKTAFLIEWFAEHEEALDTVPAGVRSILEDPHHPAVAHFDAETRHEIAAALGQATVRDIGIAMMRARLGPGGPKVSNPVYNAAANVVTALLGGPEGLTARIHRRFPEAQGLTVRRYMLAARNTPQGDNTATPRGLATVLTALARHAVPGLSSDTVRAVREALRWSDLPGWDTHFRKGGSLNSNPQCRIASGWVEGSESMRVFVVMVEQPTGAVPARALDTLAHDLTQTLLRATAQEAEATTGR